MRVTEAELLDALAASLPGSGPEHARTALEMADESGISVPRVRKALKALQVAGRLQSHRVQRMDLSGRVQILPAYTIEAKA